MGRIEDVTKEGLHATSLEGRCEIMDVTSVIVVSPTEYRGRRHLLYTEESVLEFPLGRRGDLIEFLALRQHLEADDDSNPAILVELEKTAEPGATDNPGDAQ